MSNFVHLNNGLHIHIEAKNLSTAAVQEAMEVFVRLFAHEKQSGTMHVYDNHNDRHGEHEEEIPIVDYDADNEVAKLVRELVDKGRVVVEDASLVTQVVLNGTIHAKTSIRGHKQADGSYWVQRI